MIVKISPKLGADPAGLLAYLFGPGRRNEHTDPHIVAAADGLIEDGWRPTSRTAVADLARALGKPYRLWRGDHPGGYIWHCSLSVRSDDRVLSDAEWADAARYVMDAMGFTAVSGNAQCRWVAVRHGVSMAGNDHIHLAVDLVRENGRRASTSWERVRMSKIAGELERRFGLAVVAGRAGAGLPGVSRAEAEIAVRTGKTEPDRIALARIVRAAATAYHTEALFVARLRDHPAATIRPRYAKGGTEQVVGYAVAFRPRGGRAAIWFGGGKLAPDLTLPRLRARWRDSDEARAAALSAWTGTEPRKSWNHFDASAWTEGSAKIANVVDYLSSIPVDDRAAWVAAAREAAGLYAALSSRLEGPRAGPLARAAYALSYSAQTHIGEPRARAVGAVRDLRGAAMVALQAGPFGHTVEGQIAFHRALIRLTRVIMWAHSERAEADAATRLATSIRDQLQALHDAQAHARQAAPSRFGESTPAAQRPQPLPTRRPNASRER